MKYGIIIASIAVILLVGGGLWWLLMRSDEAPTEQTTNSSTEPQFEESKMIIEDEEVEASIVITYTDDGFRLSGNTIQAGETVLVVNESNENLDFASDPHPQHTDNHELNADIIRPGEQKTIVVTDTGAWGFHNHLNDEHTGTITVID